VGGRLALAVAAGPSACSVYRLGPEESNDHWNPSRKKRLRSKGTGRTDIVG
jgi:hypothetical protein